LRGAKVPRLCLFGAEPVPVAAGPAKKRRKAGSGGPDDSLAARRKGVRHAPRRRRAKQEDEMFDAALEAAQNDDVRFVSRKKWSLEGENNGHESPGEGDDSSAETDIAETERSEPKDKGESEKGSGVEWLRRDEEEESIAFVGERRPNQVDGSVEADEVCSSPKGEQRLARMGVDAGSVRAADLERVEGTPAEDVFSAEESEEEDDTDSETSSMDGNGPSDDSEGADDFDRRTNLPAEFLVDMGFVCFAYDVDAVGVQFVDWDTVRAVQRMTIIWGGRNGSLSRRTVLYGEENRKGGEFNCLLVARLKETGQDVRIMWLKKADDEDESASESMTTSEAKKAYEDSMKAAVVAVRNDASLEGNFSYSSRLNYLPEHPELSKEEQDLDGPAALPILKETWSRMRRVVSERHPGLKLTLYFDQFGQKTEGERTQRQLDEWFDTTKCEWAAVAVATVFRRSRNRKRCVLH